MQQYRGKIGHFIAPFEVATHNQMDDCWISFLGKVFDVTPLIAEYQNTELINPILTFAGKDIGHWFNEAEGDIQTYIHPISGVRVPYLPYGNIPHADLPTPSADWKVVLIPWWKNDRKYLVGPLTKRVRPINIINMLIGKVVRLNVCCEDSIYRIMERYSIFNDDATNYTCRYDDRNLNMKKNLEQNGIYDERDDFTSVGLPESLYTPAIYIYYNDDMKYYLPDSSDEGDIP